MKKLLIVVDMQNDFIDGSLGTPEAQAVVPKVAQKIKEWEGKIIVTQDTHFDNYLTTQEGINLPVMHCQYRSFGHILNNAVASALKLKSGVKYIEKSTFASTKLFDIVKDYDPDSIQLCGLCTDICVVSNALLLKAFFPEKPIAVDSACCAGVTPDKHAAALETMRSCQIEVI